ncbi:MAG: zinc ABC transporter substrate-binding protein [Firmicutes bacterium]|nr:zinc ABC transporter substrate-binding protein [Bacillota bacterium]
MTKKRNLIFTLLLLGAVTFCVAGCQVIPRRASKPEQVEIITTIFPLADLARQLGGDRVTVSCLLPAGASPHDFEPAMEQVKAVSRALLFIYMGGGLDDWAAATARAGTGQARQLGLLERSLEQGWLPPGEYPDENPEEPGSANRFNPHLWLDPLSTRDYLCPAITDALVELDPDCEAYYRANLAAYQEELTALDEEISAELSGLPGKSFLSVHAAWHYFAARYGLDEAAVITEFPGQEPAAAELSELVDFCREQRIGVVATEPQFSTAVAAMIAGEIGGEMIVLDPLGGAELAQRDSYLSLIRYNTAVLKDALTNQK